MLESLNALSNSIDDVQRELIKALLRSTKGSRTQAALHLRIKRTTLVEMMRRLKLSKWMPEVRYPLDVRPASSLKIDGFDYDTADLKCHHQPTKTTLVKIKMVMHALENNNNNRTKAALELGLDPRTVQRLVNTAKATGFIK